MSTPPPKALSPSKLRAIAEWPCDGVPRFVVAGSVLAVKVPYSTAYNEIFKLSGGTMGEPDLPGGKPCRIFSHEGLRRIAALNQLYLPHARKFIEAQQVARDLMPNEHGPS